MVICSKRNPYSRVVSMWRRDFSSGNKCLCLDRPFPAHVMNSSILRMLDFMDLETVDYFISLENIEKDIEALPFVKRPITLDNKFMTMPRDKHWTEYYKDNPKAQDIVYETLKDEFLALNYPYELPLI